MLPGDGTKVIPIITKFFGITILEMVYGLLEVIVVLLKNKAHTITRRMPIE